MAAIALPQYQKAVARARVTEALVNLNVLRQAEQRYYLENSTYTTDMTQLDVELPETDYYWYRVQDTSDGGGSWRIYANARKNSVPNFEYGLSHSDRWCYASSSSAKSVCATLGTESHTGVGYNWYKMN